MNIKYITVKPGSIILTKDYGKLKKFWYKLIGKELPYNSFTLLLEEADIWHTKDDKNTVVVQPKKNYNTKEFYLLTKLVDNSVYPKGYPFTTAYDISIEDLFTIINAVRPNTFKGIELKELLESKYYLTTYLDARTEWNEYIY